MAVTTSNLIMGPATLYIANFGVSEVGLDTNINATPAASAFTDLGGTMDGTDIEIAQNYTKLQVDQIVDTPGQRLTERVITAKTNMAEPTLANLAIALNDGVQATGAGFNSYTPNFASSATQPTYRALLIDGFAPQSFRRRLLLRKVLSTNGLKYSAKKGDQSVFEVTFECHYVSASLAPFVYWDATS